ncbi:MAG: thiolase family protein [Salipiger marinus]|uniref:thiolase family protein n=1 Tax=Salipiger marinus TaxID=555512 RepID=UPI0040599D16
MGDLARLSAAFRGGRQLSEGRSVTAGNASQLSDGASAAVVMEEAEVTRRRLTPLGRHVGIAVAGCDPDEMGIGPVHAVPKLLAAHGGVQRGVRQPSPGQRGRWICRWIG